MALGVYVFLSLFGLAPGLLWAPLAALLGGLTSLPCAALGLLSSSFVRNINQFQTVYSFLIAPIYFLSGVFFPIEPMPTLFQNLVQISPFAHGVRLMQLMFWHQLTWRAVLWHGGILCLFSLALGLWSAKRIHAKLIA